MYLAAIANVTVYCTECGWQVCTRGPSIVVWMEPRARSAVFYIDFKSIRSTIKLQSKSPKKWTFFANHLGKALPQTAFPFKTLLEGFRHLRTVGHIHTHTHTHTHIYIYGQNVLCDSLNWLKSLNKRLSEWETNLDVKSLWVSKDTNCFIRSSSVFFTYDFH